MEVTITQFRRSLFDLVSRAMEGNEVWVSYKGRRFRIAPENQPEGRLARVTPLDVIVNEDDSGETSLREEMTQAWERDWSEL